MPRAPSDAIKPQRILVVDDNPINRRIAEAHLLGAGYAVAQAEGGERALELFDEFTPDLVLLDAMMPGMDGFETCRRLRQTQGGGDVAIAFLTSLSDLEGSPRALDSGADDFLGKPIHRAELLVRVRSLLWMKRLKDELRLGNQLIAAQQRELRQGRGQWRDLVSDAVHDLKNPLIVVLMSAASIAEDERLSDGSREALLDIIDSGQRMQRLVSNLLDVIRSEREALIPRSAHVDLAALLADVVAQHRTLATARSQRIELATRIAGRTVALDPGMFRRLLENLIENALRYSPPGSVVRLEAEIDPAGALDVRLYDEGPAVPAELREAIFERSGWGQDPAAAAPTGRGLGLMFCRLAAEALGGRIRVEEISPKGGCCQIHLPLASETISDAEPGAPSMSQWPEGSGPLAHRVLLPTPAQSRVGRAWAVSGRAEDAGANGSIVAGVEEPARPRR